MSRDLKESAQKGFADLDFGAQSKLALSPPPTATPANTPAVGKTSLTSGATESFPKPHHNPVFHDDSPELVRSRKPGSKLADAADDFIHEVEQMLAQEEAESQSVVIHEEDPSDDDEGEINQEAVDGLVEKIESADPTIFSINFDDLADIEQVAGGNFGHIYRAKYFDSDVAVKQLLDIDDEDMHKYIEREMANLRDLRHPNIVQFLGLSRSPQGIFIVTEFVPGGDLRLHLKNRKMDLPWELRVDIATDTASAMAYLHSKGIMHRDLKSGNLLVAENWTIKICDFGFSRNIDREEFMTLCGTDRWMAPEVMLGDRYDEKADIFSYGMVLQEIITRRKPPLRPAGRAFAMDVNGFKTRVPDGCPEGLVQLAIECAEFYPEKRPSFRSIVIRLKAIAKQMEEDYVAKQRSQATSQCLADDLQYMSFGEVIEEEEEEE